MENWLNDRVLADLSDDLGSIPSTHSVIPVPGDLMPSSGLCGHQAHVWYTHRHAGKTFIHLKRNKFLEERVYLELIVPGGCGKETSQQRNMAAANGYCNSSWELRSQIANQEQRVLTWMTQVFKHQSPSDILLPASGILLPASPHLLAPTKTSTNWEPSIKMPGTKGQLIQTITACLKFRILSPSTKYSGAR